MTIFTKKFDWRILSTIGVGSVIALLSGVPVIADDTELLLLNPDPAANPKPNVMFILDTSGSMDTEEATTEPYDYTQIYSNGSDSCNTDAIYWTDIGLLPDCSGGGNNTQWVEKASFQCAAATAQLRGIGSYTNTAVQYRAEDVKPARWQYLQAGNETGPVECQEDAGVHGDGRDNVDYAAAGADLSDPWTGNAGSQLAFGSPPSNLSYTFYDGNFLNWKASPNNTVLTRLAIMKDVTKRVLSSLNNMNVGIMRFNDNDGGPVLLGITDLESNRATIDAAIDSLPHQGKTPLSETLYEAALYWRGMPAYYGQRINQTPTDPNALSSTSPEIYRQPNIDVCAKNYNVLLTDGLPNENNDELTLVPTLPNFSNALGRASCTYTADGDCLDDIAEYLSIEDIDTVMDGTQTVTTHTIGFNTDFELLEDTALVSGGRYFVADDVESLTTTLLEIVANINDKSVSFSAPAVSVNTFNRTQNLNDLYLTMFGARPKTHWPGNLKKYEITNVPVLDPDGEVIEVNPTITDANGAPAVNATTGFFDENALSFWTSGGPDGDDVTKGGAAKRLTDPSARNLFTNNGTSNSLTASNNLLTPSNVGAFTNADFGLTGANGEPTIEQIIRWARGEDIRDEDNDTATTVRGAMGDPLHSQPAAVVYGGSATNPDVVVYTATNDGYLHAINGATGDELWSFVPKELLSNFTRLYFDPDARYKQYGIDGNVVPVVKDVNRNGVVDGADFVYLVFGMRRGGTTYYALNVTNKNSPQLMWQVNYPEIGESWSTPVVTRMDIDSSGLNADKAVVVLGGGYDTVHDTAEHPSASDTVGAGLHILDLESGVRLWRAGADSDAELTLNTTGREMNRAIPNEVRVVDLNGNGFADRMYASDISGQIWRFDITNGNIPANLVNGGIIARVGAEGLSSPSTAVTRRFYNTPDPSLFLDRDQNRRFISLSIGTGYRAHPFDLRANDRFYSIRDPDVVQQADAR